MNAAEMKLDLFRRLERLDNNRLEYLYNKILPVFDADLSDDTLGLPVEVKKAIDEALISSSLGRVHTHDEALKKTKEKYSNLLSL